MDSLARWIARKGPLSEEHAVGWIVRLTKTLEPVHRLGLAHGRLSADALRIGGLSCHEPGSLAPVAEVSDRVPYHSPERAVGGAASPANDTWATAVILYQALTGAFPFPAATDEELRLRLSGELPRRLAHYDVDHYDLQHVLDRALAPERDGRMKTMRDLRIALVALHPASGLLAPLKFGGDDGLGDSADVEDEPRPRAPRARPSDSGATPLGLASIPASRRRTSSTSDMDPFAPGGSSPGSSSPGQDDEPDEEEATLVVSQESLGIAGVLPGAVPPARRSSERPPPSSKRPPPPPSSKRPPPPSSRRPPPPPKHAGARPARTPAARGAGAFDVDLDGLDGASSSDRGVLLSRKLPTLVDERDDPDAEEIADTEIRQAETKKALAAVRARARRDVPREPTPKQPAPKQPVPGLPASKQPAPEQPSDKQPPPRKQQPKRRRRRRRYVLQLFLMVLIAAGVVFAIRPHLLRRTEDWVFKVAIPKAKELLGLQPPPAVRPPDDGQATAATTTAPPHVEPPGTASAASSGAAGEPSASSATTVDAADARAPAADAGTTESPEQLKACVSALLLEDAFVGVEPDLGFLCTETHPHKGATALKVQIVRAGGRGVVTTAMQELSLLGWYEIAGFVVIRERCCDRPAPLEMPDTLDHCKLEQAMARVGTTGFGGDPARIDPALDDYFSALQCLYRVGAGASYGMVRLTHAGSRSAFRKMLDRIRETKTP